MNSWPSVGEQRDLSEKQFVVQEAPPRHQPERLQIGEGALWWEAAGGNEVCSTKVDDVASKDCGTNQRDGVEKQYYASWFDGIGRLQVSNKARNEVAAAKSARTSLNTSAGEPITATIQGHFGISHSSVLVICDSEGRAERAGQTRI